MHSALNHTLALVLWGTDASGEDDVAVFSGVLIAHKGKAYLQRDSGDVPLEPDWLERIAAVPPELRPTLLDCDYQLSLTVGDVDEETSKTWKPLGLQWPS